MRELTTAGLKPQPSHSRACSLNYNILYCPQIQNCIFDCMQQNIIICPKPQQFLTPKPSTWLRYDAVRGGQVRNAPRALLAVDWRRPCSWPSPVFQILTREARGPAPSGRGPKSHRHQRPGEEGFGGLRQMQTGTHKMLGVKRPEASETRRLDVPLIVDRVPRGLRRKGTEACVSTSRPRAESPEAPRPQVPPYRMKPVSVVIVSPGTTRCFLVSRLRLSLRGLRATGSLISIAILAPMTCAGAACAIYCSANPRVTRRGGAGRGGASERPPMRTHGLWASLTIGNRYGKVGTELRSLQLSVPRRWNNIVLGCTALDFLPKFLRTHHPIYCSQGLEIIESLLSFLPTLSC